jgi:hypothetical protein
MMAISTWNPDWFALPGRAVCDCDQPQVAAVARTPANLDLFVIGADNRVHSTYWSEAGGWNGDWFAVPGDAVFNRHTQKIAAVSRAPGNLDLFVIGFDNRVWSTFWSDLRGWHGDWFPLPGKAVFDHQTQHIATVARTPLDLDLFVIGFDQRGWSTAWSTAHGWLGDFFPLPGHAVFDYQTQRIAAVARAPGNLDLFILGPDRHAWSTFWSDTDGWHDDWFPLPGRTQFDPNQHIAAVASTPDHLDLFAIGFDNHVWSTCWSAARGWHGDWFILPGNAVFQPERQQVTAVSRAPGHLDLFVPGVDNRAWSTSWSAAGGWSRDWVALPGQARLCGDLRQLAVVARAQSNLHVFAPGSDQRVWSMFATLPAMRPAPIPTGPR